MEETNEQSSGGFVCPLGEILWHAMILALCVSMAMIAVVDLDRSDEIQQENGPLENAQAIILASTVAIGMIAAVRSRRPLWSLIALTIACLAAGGLTREIQSCESATFVAGFCISRSIKRVIVGGLVTVLAVRWIYAVARQRRFLRPLITPGLMVSMLPFAACMVIAELAEKADYMLVEEFVELTAYCLLASVNLWALRHPKPSRSAAAES